MQTESADRTSVDKSTDTPPSPSSRPEEMTSIRRKYAAIAPLFVLLILWIWLFYSEGAFKGGPGGKALGGDYAMFISAAQLVHSHRDPYEPATLIRTEAKLLRQLHAPAIPKKQRPQVRVGNPPLLYWAMGPLVGRPFVLTAWASLLSLYALSALGFVAVLRYCGWRRLTTPTVAFLLMPQVVLGAFYGNPIGIVFAALGAGLLASRRYSAVAGAILCLAWLKPPIALPIVLLFFLFLVRKPVRFALGFGSASLCLLLVTLATTGPGSLVEWLHGLVRYSNDMAIQPDIISLNGLYVRWAPPAPRLALECLTLGAAVGLTVWVWNRERNRDISLLSMAPLWVVWLLAAPYGHFFDEIVLAVPMAAYLGPNGAMVRYRWPVFSLYLIFFSLFFISWTPGGVYLLPIPLLMIAALMVMSRRDIRFQHA